MRLFLSRGQRALVTGGIKDGRPAIASGASGSRHQEFSPRHVRIQRGSSRRPSRHADQVHDRGLHGRRERYVLVPLAGSISSCMLVVAFRHQLAVSPCLMTGRATGRSTRNLLRWCVLTGALMPAMIQGSGVIVHIIRSSANFRCRESLLTRRAKTALSKYSKGLSKEVSPEACASSGSHPVGSRPIPPGPASRENRPPRTAPTTRGRAGSHGVARRHTDRQAGKAEGSGGPCRRPPGPITRGRTTGAEHEVGTGTGADRRSGCSWSVPGGARRHAERLELAFAAYRRSSARSRSRLRKWSRRGCRKRRHIADRARAPCCSPQVPGRDRPSPSRTDRGCRRRSVSRATSIALA